MTTAIFNTPKTSRNLKAAGVDARQAEAIVTTMAEAFDDAVATKANLAGLKADFKIFKFVFAPAVIILLLKIAFFS